MFFLFQRAEQRVSTVARSIMGGFFVAVLVFFGLVWAGTWHWLDFLYACSYIKLTITLIKYIPQVRGREKEDEEENLSNPVSVIIPRR